MSQQITNTAPAISDSSRSSIVRTPAATEQSPPNGNNQTQEGDSLVDSRLRWVKEFVAALIGVTLVVCLVLLIWQSFSLLGGDPNNPSFQRVKDLLLFI